MTVSRSCSMGVPISQMWTVASYVVGKKLRGDDRYPLVLMLEPLFRCNLACAGCGKIQYPAEILRKNLSVEDCLRADGGDSRRRAAAASTDRRDCRRYRGPQEVCVHVHECAASRKAPAQIHA